MNIQALDFEQPLVDLEKKIEELQQVLPDNPGVKADIEKLEKKAEKMRKNIFSGMTSLQRTQMSRHPNRPYTLDYIELIFEDFFELHGDRNFGDDPAIIAGVAKMDGDTVFIIGHQKGRNTQDKIFRNFGMPNPEGYRKALRLMEMAARFNKPILTFIDTPGAYPGLGAEERGQGEAIARNLREMARLPVPIVATIIGEGGSGGALALGVGDVIQMMENSVYSVISPEGCAAILWKSADKAKDAADALKLTSFNLKELGVVDVVVPEPPGGAHRDFKAAAENLKASIIASLDKIKADSLDELVERRYEKFRQMGSLKES